MPSPGEPEAQTGGLEPGGGTMTVPAPALEARGLSKSYGHVSALVDVDFAAYPGEVVALVGDNGAGKSTFVKTVAGVVRPDHGSILVDGRAVEFHSPVSAREHGVEVVYQDLALAPDLSIWANLFLGREQRRRGIGGALRWLDKPAMREQARSELGQLRVRVPSVDAPVEDLSGGQRQAVAVARACAWGQRIVLFDEPTAALGVEQGRQVAELITTLAQRDVAIVLISHNLAEVFALAHRIVVFRHGRRVAERIASETDVEEVVRLITGAQVDDDPGSHTRAAGGER